MPLFLGTLGGISPDRCYTRDFLRFYRRRATFSILFNILSVTNDEEKAGFAGLSLPSSTQGIVREFATASVSQASSSLSSSSISNRLPQIRLRHSVIEILVTYLPCASIRDPRGFIPGRIIRLDEREQERATIEKSMKQRRRGRGGEGGPDRSRNSRNFKTDRLLLVAD